MYRKNNSDAKFGVSKENRNDCPLVALANMLDEMFLNAEINDNIYAYKNKFSIFEQLTLTGAEIFYQRKGRRTSLKGMVVFKGLTVKMPETIGVR